MIDKKKSIKKIIKEKQIVIKSIIIKPDQGVDPVKGSGLGLHGLTRSTRINLEKLKKNIKVLIFYIKKLRNNPYKYRLYMF